MPFPVPCAGSKENYQIHIQIISLLPTQHSSALPFVCCSVFVLFICFTLFNLISATSPSFIVPMQICALKKAGHLHPRTKKNVSCITLRVFFKHLAVSSPCALLHHKTEHQIHSLHVLHNQSHTIRPRKRCGGLFFFQRSRFQRVVGRGYPQRGQTKA